LVAATVGFVLGVVAMILMLGPVPDEADEYGDDA